MNKTKPSWVRIAGYAPNISKKKPPYWRYCLGENSTSEQKLIHEVRIEGLAQQSNFHDGMEVDAPFLLWFQVFGAHSLSQEKDRIILTIKIIESKSSFTKMIPVQEISGKIHVYGAPDLVRAGHNERWRCVVNGREFVVRSIVVDGTVSRSSFRTAENVSLDNELQYRRQWLEFHGKFETDILGNAQITI